MIMKMLAILRSASAAEEKERMKYFQLVSLVVVNTEPKDCLFNPRAITIISKVMTGWTEQHTCQTTALACRNERLLTYFDLFSLFFDVLFMTFLKLLMVLVIGSLW